MTNLFYHGRNRMSQLLQGEQNQILRAQAYEALECMTEAFRGKSQECEELEKKLERLQKRYIKFKEE